MSTHIHHQQKKDRKFGCVQYDPPIVELGIFYRHSKAKA